MQLAAPVGLERNAVYCLPLFLSRKRQIKTGNDLGLTHHRPMFSQLRTQPREQQKTTIAHIFLSSKCRSTSWRYFLTLSLFYRSILFDPIAWLQKCPDRWSVFIPLISSEAKKAKWLWVVIYDHHSKIYWLLFSHSLSEDTDQYQTKQTIQHWSKFITIESGIHTHTSSFRALSSVFGFGIK